MKTEVLYLIYVTLLTGLLWVPYILNRLLVWGMAAAVGYPDDPKPQSPWARRLMKAHANGVENLVIFAPLVLTAQVLGVSTPAIATASMVYFWARLVHAIAYTLAVPWVRTLGFMVGVGAQLTVALQILGH